eukprot:gene6426-10434_t
MFIGTIIYMSHKIIYLLIIIIIVFIIIIPTILFLFILNYNIHEETRWNWSSIEINEKSVAQKIYKAKGKGFLFGTASSAHQIEGNNTNNWSEWEKGENRIENDDYSGLACDHYNNYKEDIQLMKDFNLNSYRFSIEWSRIQPENGDSFIDEEMDHYIELIKELLKNNIEPIITFHHFTNPIWFESKGGFEFQQNLIHFEKFCSYVFKKTHNMVKYYCTINELEIYSLMGYVSKTNRTFPPGKKSLSSAIQVLKNLCIVHTNVYQKLKVIDPKCKIGIVKHYSRIRPLSLWNPIQCIGALLLNYFRDFSILFFFKHGIFFVPIPFIGSFYHNEDAPVCLDFIGVNYFSDIWLTFEGWSLSHDVKWIDKDKSCDMGNSIYAEGFHAAISNASQFKVPIIITENGIADERDKLRSIYLRRHLHTMAMCLEEGFDIDGYMYWSLYDTFEWASGYSMKFGLYENDFSNQNRKLRNGSKFYNDVIQEYNKLCLEETEELVSEENEEVIIPAE